MTDMKNITISDEALEGVLGGVIVTVQNDACGYANIRHEPSLNGIIAMKAKNGTRLNTVVNEIFSRFMPTATSGIRLHSRRALT